jgi:uncharacterized protein
VLDDPSQALLFVVVQDTAFFVLTIGFFWVGVSVARRLGRPVGYSLAPLGFSKPKRGYLAGVGLGLTVGTVALVASLLITPLSAYVVEELGYSSESRVQGPFREGLASWVGESPETAIPAIVAVVVFLGPAAEELVFRGAVFGGLYRLGLFFSRKLGGKPEGKPDGRGRGTGEQVSFALSALISSVLFSLVHLEPVILLVLFILAVVLCALYRRTKSLLPCLVAHATFNSFAVLVVILMGLGALPVPPI